MSHEFGPLSGRNLRNLILPRPDPSGSRSCPGTLWVPLGSRRVGDSFGSRRFARRDAAFKSWHQLPPRARRAASRAARLFLLTAVLTLVLGGQAVRAAGGPTFAPSFAGTLVRLALSGHEPDFDPIYRLIISARLHDPAPAGRALPDSMLVLSSYLESFSPSTAPILPDLLNPDQPADGLRGFLQGKAALVSAGGKIAYSGSLLAEIFRGNRVHLVVTLQREGGSPLADPLRLQGIFGLNRGAMHGTLRASGPLDRAALAVPSHPWPSWQTVVGQLVVHPPPMLGAPAAPPSSQGTAPPAISQAPIRPGSVALAPLPATPIRGSSVVPALSSGAQVAPPPAFHTVPARPVVPPAPRQVAARTVTTPPLAKPPSGQAGGSGPSAITALAIAAALVLGTLAALLWRQSKRTAAPARHLPAAAPRQGQ